MFFKALLAFLALPCVVAGWDVACGSPLLFAYLALPAVVFHLHIVLREEPWLAQRHSQQWQEYSARVSRWLPVRPRR